MIRRPPRSTLSSSSAASDVYKRQRPRQDKEVAKTRGALWAVACDKPLMRVHGPADEMRDLVRVALHRREETERTGRGSRIGADRFERGEGGLPFVGEERKDVSKDFVRDTCERGDGPEVRRERDDASAGGDERPAKTHVGRDVGTAEPVDGLLG